MLRAALCLLLASLAACHGFFGNRTTDADQELNNFAEARQRAATYYDGGDYLRAAAQYEKALGFKPNHLPTKMGLAFSLMFANRPSSLTRAEIWFNKIGTLRDPRQEVKRIYGLALTHRSLAVHYGRRARLREDQGRIKLAADDIAGARRHAREGIVLFKKVMEFDARLAKKQAIGPMRVSASLEPDAHIGIAHCEILLIEPDPTKETELRGHLEAAEHHLAAYGRITRNARRFWEKRREALLVTDPLKDDRPPGARIMDPEMIKRYEERIANTVQHEVAVRQALMETLLYVNRYPEAIKEGTKILDLDPAADDILILRGNAYAFLQPPDYRAALRDLKAYRKRQDLSQLTDNMVRLNRRIRRYEAALAKQKDY
ncbi:MAG: hypothetical protein ACYTEZ_10600 [Planctomycetota bacterium]|jgi:tetratricopeptide (TPR) repeat protein